MSTLLLPSHRRIHDNLPTSFVVAFGPLFSCFKILRILNASQDIIVVFSCQYSLRLIFLII